ncbi:hypothetical protein [Aquimarina rubra]|uniref:Alpha/beta hydrolase n=1 Tax=Aquimarina rubra TaxID=1920033 RepID=A0ABW5L9L5_9FLAO
MMKNMYFFFLLGLLFSCSEDDSSAVDPQITNFTVSEFDSSIEAPFGSLPYRVYYPKELTGDTYPIILSRGGNGQGDDRGKLVSYATNFIAEGYVVVQVDHRNAGNDIENIARLRGEEIQFISQKIADGQLDYGDFAGNVVGAKQGYMGHSAGAMEGMLAAGMNMTHGNYLAPSIKAVYAMSPPGYAPDQFGIAQNPNGYGSIDQAAIFMIIGEDEKDSNGPGTIQQDNWRLQGYDQMNADAFRMMVLVKGSNTQHEDVAGLNSGIKAYNEENSVALFDSYLKGKDRNSEIGNLSPPSNNEMVISTKGN